MIWLGIETSNAPLSVAIVKDGQVLAEVIQNVKRTHSVTAMPTIQEVLEMAKIEPQDLDGIVVSEGPGSYTGVRIGVTIAKTLAWTLKKPLVGVSSLKVLAANAKFWNGLICPIIDARRKTVFAAVYNGQDLSRVVPEEHMELKDLLTVLSEKEEPVLFIGQDAFIHQQAIEETLGDQATFAQAPFNLPRASQLIELAKDEEQIGGEEIHHFVPKYYRLAEAEANWIKEQKGSGQDGNIPKNDRS